jgi:cytoskeleton protein RodZ
MGTLGQELKKKREERGITLRQISDETHIGVRFLESLEADEFKSLPGGIFTRAFVRKFAKFIGFDEATAIQLYEEQLAAAGGEEDRRFQMGVENWDTPQRSNSGPLLALVVLIILSAGAYLAYSYFTSSGEEGPVSPTPAATALSPEFVATPTPTPEPSPTPAPTPDQLRLRPAILLPPTS